MHARTITVGVGIAVAAIAGTAVATLANGAGAELPAAAFQSWCTTSKACSYHVADSRGLAQLRTGKITWAGADEELPRSQVRQAGGPVAYFPVMLTGIAVATNVPGVTGQRIRLRGATIGEIFSGVITSWGDRRIRVVNRRLHFPPDLPITLCVPAKASGESWDFSEWLAKVSPAFRRRSGGESLTPRWRARTIVRTAHVQMTGECMSEHPGAITFLPLADAGREGLMHHVISVGKREKVTQVSGGTRRVVERNVYVYPSSESIQKAGDRAGRQARGDLTVDLTNSAEPGAYPVAVEGYAIVRKDRPVDAATRKAITYFLSAPAQAALQGLGYVAIPKSLADRGREQLSAAP